MKSTKSVRIWMTKFIIRLSRRSEALTIGHGANTDGHK